jgi:PAS domain S-box-containing protein
VSLRKNSAKVSRAALEGDGQDAVAAEQALAPLAPAPATPIPGSSEDLFRLAQEAAHIGTWEWDPTTDTRTLSAELHRLFGTDPSDPHHAEAWTSRVHRDDRPEVEAAMKQGYDAGFMEFEYRYQHPEQGLRWFFCKGRRVLPQSRMYGIVLDVTERKNAEIGAARLAAIVESSEDAIVSKNLDGVITSWNTGAQRIFEYTPEEAIGRHITLIIPPEHQDEETEILRRLRAGQRIDHFDTVRVAKSGRLVDVSLTISPIKDSQQRVVGASKIARDVTDRKQVERALREAHELLEQRVRERTAELELAQEALRNLSGRLMQAQDEERRRIARELHDSAGQLLAAINMNMVPIQSEAGKLGPQFSKAVDESLDLVDQLSQELRTISHLLHPPMLDEAGLEFALQWFVEGFARRSKIDVNFELAPEIGRLSRGLETTIFRLVQECLTNIHRHSGSPTAQIRITQHGEELRMEICDQGRGMLQGNHAKPGVGVQGMRERVRLLGGRLDIRSSPGSGTAVLATLPLAQPVAEVSEVY